MQDNRSHSWKLFFSVLFIILGFWGLLLGLIPKAHATEIDYIDFTLKEEPVTISNVNTISYNTIYFYLPDGTPLTPKYLYDNPDCGIQLNFDTTRTHYYFYFDVYDLYGIYNIRVYDGGVINWALFESKDWTTGNSRFETPIMCKFRVETNYSSSTTSYFTISTINYDGFNSGSNPVYPETPTDPEETTPTDPSEDDNSGNIGAGDSGGIGGDMTEEDDSQGIIDSITSFFENFFTNLFKPFVELYETFTSFFSKFESIGEWWESLGEYVDLENPLKPLRDFFDSLDSGVFALIADFWTWPIIGELLSCFVLVLVVGGIILLFVTL